MTKIGPGISLFDLAAASSGCLDVGTQLWWIGLQVKSILEGRHLPAALFWSSLTNLAAAHPVCMISLFMGVAGLLHVN